MDQSNNGQTPQNDQNALVRFIGRVKSRICNGAQGQFFKYAIWMDNPKAVNADGTANQYYKGHLIWFDAAQGKHFLIKQVELAGVSEDQKAKGFTNSLKLNLGDAYHVEPMD